MIIEFDTRGNEKQKTCVSHWLDDDIDEIIYGGSKGSGKSFLGCSLILGDALIYPETFYFIARKELNDLRKYTKPSIHEVLSLWGITTAYYKYNGQDNYYQFYNGSRVYLIHAKYEPSDPQYQRFGSMQMTRGWIEEAGEFELDCKNNLKIAIGRWNNKQHGLKGKLLQTCNPSKNYLYTDYKKNKNNELESYKRFIQALPTDNKMLSEDYLRNLDRTLTGAEKERLLKGNWEYDDDPTALCEYESILDTFTNSHAKQSNKRYITADIAAYGSDYFRVGVWQDWNLIKVVSFSKSGGQLVVDTLKKLQVEFNIKQSSIVFDSDGVGGLIGGNTGFLPRAKAFLNNSKPIVRTNENKEYQNLKTQCYYHLAEKINENKLYISANISVREREQVIEEMEQIKSNNDIDIKKLKILDKKTVKGNIGRSPDFTDMMAMRAIFDFTVTQKTFVHTF
jgi:phage terminase large subunit